MYCKNCGANIDDKAVVCPHCGVATREAPTTTTTEKSNAVAIVGFVFSLLAVVAWYLFFIPAPVRLTCSILGYNKAVKHGAGCKGLSVAGIVLGALAIAFWVMIFALIFLDDSEDIAKIVLCLL